MEALPPRSSWNVAKPTGRPLPPKLDGLLEEGVDALPVRIVIEQDGWVTGWDDGALGFEEDAVWFSGRACSFRIVACDVTKFSGETDGLVTTRMQFHLRIRHPTRCVVLNAKVLPFGMRKEWEDEGRLAREIERMIRLSTGIGASQYPPLTIRTGTHPMDSVEWRNAGLKSTWWSWPFSHGRDLMSMAFALARDRLLKSISEEDIGTSSTLTAPPLGEPP